MLAEAELITHLKRRGLTRVQAQRWLTFLLTSLEMLEEAAVSLAVDPMWQSLLNKVVGRNLEEPDITTELYAHMKVIQRLSEIGSPRREVHLGCEDPVISQNRSGKSSKKADLVFAILRHKIPLYFVLEAKLLRKKGDVSSSYLGEGGLGCFTSIDSPYTIQEVGGMIGYTQSLSVDAWNEYLLEALDNISPDPVSSFGDVGVSHHYPRYTFSDIERTALGLCPLFLLHRMLAFPATA